MTISPNTLPDVTPGAMNLMALPVLLQTASPVIFEVGSHNGFHTKKFLSLFPQGRVYCFEPDRRAQQSFKANINDPRAFLFHVAIGREDGYTEFYPSSGQNPEFGNVSQPDWDHSGSIRKPTGHLTVNPWCKFPTKVSVRVKKLDTVIEETGVEVIDFLWADVQGAEIDMIQGGRNAFMRTKYIHTEYGNSELYEGQIGLSEILDFLPSFKVLVRWENDVLLWNSLFNPPPDALIRS